MSKKSDKLGKNKNYSITDDRFKHASFDGRFKRAANRRKAIENNTVDQRFAQLDDEDYSTSHAIDQYGRKVLLKDSFFDLFGQNKEKKDTEPKKIVLSESESEAESEIEEEKRSVPDSPRSYPRGGVIETDDDGSTSIGSTDDDDDEEEGDDDYTRVLSGSIAGDTATVVENPTKRLALMNMEWEQLRAVDILAVMRSFTEMINGVVERVTVYPSEFGKERMANESRFGPMVLYSNQADSAADVTNKMVAALGNKRTQAAEDGDDDEDDDDDEDAIRLALKAANEEESDVEEEEEDIDEDDISDDEDEDEESLSLDGSGFDKEKLRIYELEKLRYFYAIIECDSANTALHLYNEADGVEYQDSSNIFDLRFVPDDQVFDPANLRDVAEKVPAKYRPPKYQTQALHHSKVECTWDREDPRRSEMLRRQFTKEDFEASDLDVFMGSDVDGEDGFATDVPISDSDGETESSSEDDSNAEGDESQKKKSKKNKKKVTVLKRRARAAFVNLLSDINQDSNEEKKRKERQKMIDKANKALNKDGDEEEESDESSSSEEEEQDDDDGADIVFQPVLEEVANRVINKIQSKKDEAARANMTLWDKFLEKKAAKNKLRMKARQARHDKENEYKKGGKKLDKDSIYQDDPIDYDPEDPFFAGAFDDEEYEDRPVGAAGAEDKNKSKSKDKKKKGEEVLDEEQLKEKARLEMLIGDTADVDAKSYSLKELLRENRRSKNLEAKKRQTYQEKEDELLDAVLGKKSKKAKTQDTEDDKFTLDINDDRFAAIHEDPTFAIDPTSAKFKATAGADLLIQESQRRRQVKAKATEKALMERKKLVRGDAKPETNKTSKKKDDSKEISSMVSKIKERANFKQQFAGKF